MKNQNGEVLCWNADYEECVNVALPDEDYCAECFEKGKKEKEG